jgi:hypothetical protein
LVQDPLRELLDLSAVHRFYIQLLERNMGHAVPIPTETAHPSQESEKINQSLDLMRRWLRLLDMAITSHMMRDEVQQGSGSPETIEALLRHYVLKRSLIDVDRDKTDFLVTYALRNPSAWSSRVGSALYGSSGETYSYIYSKEQAEKFEFDLWYIMDEEKYPLPQEVEAMVREFQYLQQEVDEFREFHQIMDSGIMPRVKEVKHKFGEYFYHPRVLSLAAVYNVFFGKRFDDLFREAATQIKAFANKVQQEGGSIMARVDGDVTVKHLADVEGEKIASQEYGRAQEHFRKIAKYKKAVDTRRGGRATAAAAAAANAGPAGGPPPPSRFAGPPVQKATVMAEPQGRTHAHAAEEAKVRGVIESIRTFIRANDGKTQAQNIVPMRNGNLVLNPTEVDAFKADYGTERSFRADYANSAAMMMALTTRMQQEVEDYRAKRDSAHLWKPHADSLQALLALSQRTLEESVGVLATAEQRGLADKVKALQASQEKLRQFMQIATQTLQG